MTHAEASQAGYDRLVVAAHAVHLDIAGAFHPRPEDACPDGSETMILLSPREPFFWPAFKDSPEYRDGQPEPMDRWSLRVISRLAKDVGGQALFPFGGPPYQPFIRWASASGRAWPSPVGLLIHDIAGLFISYRGAISLPSRLILPVTAADSPCTSCTAKPCLTACPVGAMGSKGYDVKNCRAYISGNSGQGCIDNGCAVRRACPISARHGRLPEQSAFHMKAFR